MRRGERRIADQARLSLREEHFRLTGRLDAAFQLEVGE